MRAALRSRLVVALSEAVRRHYRGRLRRRAVKPWPSLESMASRCNRLRRNVDADALPPSAINRRRWIPQLWPFLGGGGRGRERGT
eukprot:1511895-Alexandrium_andersonii.AAC.1